MKLLKHRVSLLLVLVVLGSLASCPVWTADAPVAFPKVGPYEVLRGDFHMHTVNSDGRLTARERVSEAADQGYDVMAITDHGNTRAYRIESQLAREAGIIAIRGLETGLQKSAHLVALGFSFDYKPLNPHNWAAKAGEKNAFYQDEMNRIKDLGGFLVLAHPGKDKLTPEVLWGIEHGVILGVEVRNSGNTISHSFDWALEHNLAVIADSDAHGRRSTDHIDYTLVFVTQRTPEGVIDALRARRTVALFKDTLWGREDLLSQLIRSMADVRFAAGSVSIRNAGPVPLKAVLEAEAAPQQAVEVAPGKEATIAAPAADTVTIRWDNVWTSPTEHLRTTYGK